MDEQGQERDRAWRQAQAERAERKRARRKRRRSKPGADPELIILSGPALRGLSVEEALTWWEKLEESGETAG